MNRLRLLMSLVVMCVTGASVLIPTVSYGEPLKRILPEQTTILLNADPELKKGFKTPEGTLVQVTKKRVTGGLEFAFVAYDENQTRGKVIVLGPPSVMDKGFFGDAIDKVVAIGKKTGLLSGRDEGGDKSCKVRVRAGSKSIVVDGVMTIFAQ